MSAVYAIQTTIALSPEDAEAHYNLGNALKQMTNLEDARTSYEKAIELRPAFAEAYLNLGHP